MITVPFRPVKPQSALQKGPNMLENMNARDATLEIQKAIIEDEGLTRRAIKDPTFLFGR